MTYNLKTVTVTETNDIIVKARTKHMEEKEFVYSMREIPLQILDSEFEAEQHFQLLINKK